MKKGLLFIAMIVLGWAATANALPFNDTIDFADSTFTADGVTKTGIFINDTANTSAPGSLGYDFAFTYEHNVTFDPIAASVNSAFLDITFSGNRADRVEAWFVYGQGYLDDSQDTYWKRKRLGCFSFIRGYQDYDWVTTTFDLSDLIADVNGSNWSVAFSIDENTYYANEQMFLAESRIYGDYTPAPVPEPSTWILLGSGLAGLALYRRKRTK